MQARAKNQKHREDCETWILSIIIPPQLLFHQPDKLISLVQHPSLRPNIGVLKSDVMVVPSRERDQQSQLNFSPPRRRIRNHFASLSSSFGTFSIIAPLAHSTRTSCNADPRSLLVQFELSPFPGKAEFHRSSQDQHGIFTRNRTVLNDRFFHEAENIHAGPKN